ncbi:MAG: DUF4349 domain-containing protein [Armatimonadetes bacterium]|nr:DUF4349 domain-containing protein [Armatimonadota bacterium]
MNPKEQIRAYYDQQLSPAEAAEVERALASDPTLAEELEFYKLLGRSMREQVREEPAVGMAETMAKVRSTGNVLPKKNWWPLMRTMAAACGVVVIIAVIFPIFAQSKNAAKETAASGAYSSTVATPSTESSSVEMQDGAKMPTGDMESEAKAAPSRERVAGKNAYTEGLESRAAQPPTASSKPGVSAEMHVEKNITVRVDDVEKATDEISDTVSALGGKVTNINSSITDNPTESGASLTVMVPAKNVDAFAKTLRGMGEVVSLSENSVDMSEVRISQDAQVRQLKAEEEAILNMIRRTRRLSELNSLRGQLASIQGQIAVANQALTQTKDQIRYATVQVQIEGRSTLNSGGTTTGWSNEVWASALDNLKGMGRLLGSVAIYALVYSPIWIPAALIIHWITRRRMA